MTGALTGSIKCEFADIAKMLRLIPDQFVKSDVKAVMKEKWDVIAEDARRRVPVDTGFLQQSICSTSGFNKNAGVVFTSVGISKLSKKQKKFNKLVRKVSKKYGLAAPDELLFNPARYSIFVEFGTSKMQPRPFMRPAFDNGFENALTSATMDWGTRLQHRLDKLSEAPKKEI